MKIYVYAGWSVELPIEPEAAYDLILAAKARTVHVRIRAIVGLRYKWFDLALTDIDRTFGEEIVRRYPTILPEADMPLPQLPPDVPMTLRDPISDTLPSVRSSDPPES